MRTGEKKKRVTHPSIAKPKKMPEPIEVPNWPTRVNAPVPVELPHPSRTADV